MLETYSMPYSLIQKLKRNTLVVKPRQHIFSFWTVDKESVSDLKLTLSSSDLYKWFDLASGGNSYENDTFMLILIRHFVPNRHA